MLAAEEPGISLQNREFAHMAPDEARLLWRECGAGSEVEGRPIEWRFNGEFKNLLCDEDVKVRVDENSRVGCVTRFFELLRLAGVTHWEEIMRSDTGLTKW